MARRRYRNSIWRRYVPVAERRRNATRLAAGSQRDGRALEPVEIAAAGRAIAKTFWGAAWCRNLERYSDYASRLPRGRTYVRNGSVIDLRIEPGEVQALVSGSEVYTVGIDVTRLAAARWRQLCADCAGGIDSLVELLQGRFSKGVMEVLCRPGTGMFPEPQQISMRCSCPDWATMCKHVAAVLYGVGARLDAEPELLFKLRQVDQSKLISASARGIDVASGAADEALAGEDLGALFGIELDADQPTAAAAPRTERPKKASTARRRGQAKKARKPVLDPWLTAAELRERGVAPHVVQSWLQKGLVEHSGERGIYLRTEASEALVRDHLARAKKGRRAVRRRLP